MIVQASITGLFKTILIIIGAMVVLRFLGQLMIAKRNMEEERKLNEEQRKADSERMFKLKNFGKTTILGSRSRNKGFSANTAVEDTEYEEID